MNHSLVLLPNRSNWIYLFSMLALWSFVLNACATRARAENSFNFRVILVEGKEEAQEILKRLESGEPFWKLAMERSLYPNALVGGYVENAYPSELRWEFYSTLEKLSPGEVSSIVPVREDYAILKRENAGSSKDVWKKANDRYTEALRMAAQGDFVSANEVAKQVLVLYPNHNAARYIVQIVQGVTQKTFDRKSALEIFGALMLVQEGFPQKAYEILDKLARSHPQVPEIYVVLGEVYMVQGQFPKAIDAYEKALSSPEWATFAHLYLGAAYLQQNDPSKALTHYQKAIMADIGFAQAHLGLGLVYIAIKKGKEALYQIRVALAIDPHLDPAYDHLGLLLLSIGNIQDAVWAFEKALSIRSNSPTYLSHLGFAYNRWGMFSKALEILEKALSMAPKDPTIHNNLAMAYYDSGQMERAIFHADRAKALKYPVHPDFLAKLKPYRKDTARISR